MIRTTTLHLQRKGQYYGYLTEGDQESDMDKLTDKQARFCEEYVIDFNATQAAIRAGYSKKTAGQIGEQNINKPAIRTRLRELQQKASKHLEITHEDLLSQLKTWAESDITETLGLTIAELKELPVQVRRLITKAKRTTRKHRDGSTEEVVEIHFVSKEAALDMIAKHIGFYEKDNNQRKPEIDVSQLGSDVLKALLDASSGLT